ncbi:uncharacterized protein LOC104909441 [Meleagris gallopavo]|uniref:uncharacterized protein LOC104909441 n=1 Tax=Meleagris gallopavo TaxID=9103 RepID=UPI000549C43B|nr:uncharacterized protein LOC104909441 [Meleagris gallopavo]
MDPCCNALGQGVRVTIPLWDVAPRDTGSGHGEDGLEISKVSSSHYDTLTQHAITAVCTLQEYAGAKRIQPSPAPQPPQRGHRDLAPHATLRPSPTLREPIGFLPLFSLADWSSSLPLRKLIGPPLRPSNRRGAMLSVAARFPPRGGHVSRSAVRAVRTVGGWRSSALTDPVLGAISRSSAFIDMASLSTADQTRTFASCFEIHPVSPCIAFPSEWSF